MGLFSHVTGGGRDEDQSWLPLTPPASPSLTLPSSAEGGLAPIPPLMSRDENNSSHQICIG